MGKKISRSSRMGDQLEADGSTRKQCTANQHVYIHNLCQNCERETICKACRQFSKENQVCKLCYISLVLMTPKTRAKQRSHTTNEDDLLTMTSDSGVSFAASADFHKTSLVVCENSGQVVHGEKFFSE